MGKGVILKVKEAVYDCSIILQRVIGKNSNN